MNTEIVTCRKCVCNNWQNRILQLFDFKMMCLHACMLLAFAAYNWNSCHKNVFHAKTLNLQHFNDIINYALSTTILDFLPKRLWNLIHISQKHKLLYIPEYHTCIRINCYTYLRSWCYSPLLAGMSEAAQGQLPSLWDYRQGCPSPLSEDFTEGSR